MKRPLRRPKLLFALLPALILACRPSAPRTPEALRAAYADALRRDDPDAAYDLLAPELQAELSRERFRGRWSASPSDRALQLAELEALDPGRRPAILGGTTAHQGGVVLRWAEVASEYKLIAGLPVSPGTATPAQAIRAWIAAIRAADSARLEALLTEDLRARITDDWRERVDQIEARLAEPGALELSPNGETALLRYAPGRALVVVQSAAGWRIDALN
ncbi:MAG: hypothetical protein IPK80_32040 [Nannocystis sp.]|nr:hypothetical protein [Nannocystis sp.]